jgi:hypothetical protein
MNIKGLLMTLTLEEKAGQLAQLPPFFLKKKHCKKWQDPFSVCN